MACAGEAGKRGWVAGGRKVRGSGLVSGLGLRLSDSGVWGEGLEFGGSGFGVLGLRLEVRG